MFPFRTDDIFVHNAWYVACAVHELDDGPIQRVIMERPVVIYRAESGTVMAMHGLCPHRSYPLALRGTVKGDALQCAYHGFTFDGRTGACVSVPSQDKPSGNYRQPVYRVVERGPWVWIWPGEAEHADESAIPDSQVLGLGQGWKYLPPIVLAGIKARYMLMVENLFDLTHVAFLHGDMGDFDAMLKAPITISEPNGGIVVKRTMRTAWTSHHDTMFESANRFEGESESSSITTFHLPGYVTTTDHIIAQIEGHDIVDLDRYGHVHYHHAITPETATSCHYFGMASRMHRHDDADFDAMFIRFDEAVRMQDVVAAEAIEAVFAQFGEPTVELMVKSDTAAGLARRLIQRLINEENAAHKSVSARRIAADAS